MVTGPEKWPEHLNARRVSPGRWSGHDNRTHDFQPITVGVITASILVGAIFGALVVGPLSDRVGRRRVIQLAGLIFVLGPLISIIPMENILPTLVAGRFIVGLAVGFASTASPMYLSEMSFFALSIGPIVWLMIAAFSPACCEERA